MVCINVQQNERGDRTHIRGEDSTDRGGVRFRIPASIWENSAPADELVLQRRKVVRIGIRMNTKPYCTIKALPAENASFNSELSGLQAVLAQPGEDTLFLPCPGTLQS